MGRGVIHYIEERGNVVFSFVRSIRTFKYKILQAFNYESRFPNLNWILHFNVFYLKILENISSGSTRLVWCQIYNGWKLLTITGNNIIFSLNVDLSFTSTNYSSLVVLLSFSRHIWPPKVLPPFYNICKHTFHHRQFYLILVDIDLLPSYCRYIPPFHDTFI